MLIRAAARVAHLQVVRGKSQYIFGKMERFTGCRGFGPGRRGPFVSAKVTKTMDAPTGLLKEEGRELFEERPNSRSLS